tara:strand:- start:989 stop:1402 length:414 start_codon:yes stop_codon:yes gene_type:complete
LKGRDNPPLHEFVVFSVIKDDKVTEDIAQCNNCGVMHRVVDICKSIILPDSENSRSTITIDDIRLSLPENVNSIMEANNKELADYQHLHFLITHNDTKNFVLLSSESIDGKQQGKILKYKGSGKFAIEPFSTQENIQ